MLKFLTRWSGNDSKSDIWECETQLAEGCPVLQAYKEVNIPLVPCRYLIDCYRATDYKSNSKTCSLLVAINYYFYGGSVCS